ncbi:hypothetical protein [Paenibacillus terrigena]|uniref:hypothetical protein n=1 Tax=Paenibacillus terrigena TaxID=369333 RepID=UPI0028D097A4|nr:hypothetical protein [Paenibacillus terrigena]
MDQIRIGIIGATGGGGIAKYWNKPDGESIVVAPMRLPQVNRRRRQQYAHYGNGGRHQNFLPAVPLHARLPSQLYVYRYVRLDGK